MLSMIVALFLGLIITFFVSLSAYIFFVGKSSRLNRWLCAFFVLLSADILSVLFRLMLLFRAEAFSLMPVKVLGWVSWTCTVIVLMSLIFIKSNRTEIKAFSLRYNRMNAHGMFSSNESEHKGFYVNLMMVYWLGAVSNLAYYFFYEVNPYRTIFLSTAFGGLGLIVLLMLFIRMTPHREIQLITMIVSVTIPFILFVFLEDYGSYLVWPLPLLFLLVAIVYNSRRMYALVANISTVTLLIAWLILPTKAYSFGLMDYLTRIVIYILCIVMAAYVNRSYIRKMLRINHHKHFNEVISDISADFVKVSEETMDSLSDQMLEKIGLSIGADRGYIGFLSKEAQTIEIKYEWLNHHQPSLKDSTKLMNHQMYPWFSDGLKKNEKIFVGAVNTMPVTAAAEREFMKTNGITSLLYIPILQEQEIIGVIGFDQLKASNLWHAYDDELLRIIPNIFSDALHKVASEQMLNNLAYYDTLTGLPNRAYLVNQIDQGIVAADTEGMSFGLAFIDLDGFKTINDSLGHNWGDELLKRVSKRLSSRICEQDLLARFGGDEFIVLLRGVVDPAEIDKRVKSIISVFEEPFVMGKHDFHMTISAGVVMYPEQDGDRITLMKYADIAMYEAKRRGKNQYVFYSEEINRHALKQMNITNSLYDALNNNELYLVYQPQIDLLTETLVGYEALLRWQHPDYGNIPPNVFIPIAEKTGLIHEIGEWVIRTGCEQNKRWQESGHPPVTMAINISIEQFKDAGFKDIIALALETSGLDGKYLELEITEGIAMKESLNTSSLLHDLKSLGLSISIDDFGTEYSSLKRLRNLSFDRLKIDMQFIRGIGNNLQDEAIINVLIFLSKSLGLKSIAEGVETKEQLEFLAREGCDEVQGYYYYKPMLPKVIDEAFIKNQLVNQKALQ